MTKPTGVARLRNGERRVRREVSPRAMIYLQPLDCYMPYRNPAPLYVVRKSRKSFLVRSADASDGSRFAFEIMEPPDVPEL